jgi:C-terminal processing protease CtpA/Prc
MADSARPAPFGFGVGGETRTRVGRIPRFTLGGFDLASVVTGFSRDTKGADSTGEIAGNIGGDLLRRFTVTIDYARQKMYLAPNQGLGRPFEYDMFGALLLRDGDAFVLQRVVDGSPAARAGLAVGDAIVSVDGKPASRLSFESVRQLFVSRPGKTVTLKIRNAGNVRDVVVQLERIV